MSVERRARASARRFRTSPRIQRAALSCLLQLAAAGAALAAGCGSYDPSRADGGRDMTAADAREAAPTDAPAEWAPFEAGPDGDAGDDAGAPDGLEAGGLDDAAPDAEPPLMPLSTGNRWEYEVREPGLAPYQKTQAVEPLEQVGGRGPGAAEQAFRMVTTKLGGAFGLPDKTVSWQRTEGSKIVRFREVAYRAGSDVVNSEEYWTPYKLRLDGMPLGQPPAAGQRWEERYTEHKVSISTGAVTSANHIDVWTVTAASVSVTVPAGSFSDCLELTKTDGTGADTGKTYVFCPGVGKVRETGRAGVSQSEELTRFTVVP